MKIVRSLSVIALLTLNAGLASAEANDPAPTAQPAAIASKAV